MRCRGHPESALHHLVVRECPCCCCCCGLLPVRARRIDCRESRGCAGQWKQQRSAADDPNLSSPRNLVRHTWGLCITRQGEPSARPSHIRCALGAAETTHARAPAADLLPPLSLALRITRTTPPPPAPVYTQDAQLQERLRARAGVCGEIHTQTHGAGARICRLRRGRRTEGCRRPSRAPPRVGKQMLWAPAPQECGYRLFLPAPPALLCSAVLRGASRASPWCIYGAYSAQQQQRRDAVRRESCLPGTFGDPRGGHSWRTAAAAAARGIAKTTRRDGCHRW